MDVRGHDVTERPHRRCEIPLTGVADDSLPGSVNPTAGEQKDICSPVGPFGEDRRKPSPLPPTWIPFRAFH